MIKSLIKRLKESFGFKEKTSIQFVSLDEKHEVTIPLIVTCCNFCSERVVLEVGKKESGICGREIKIRCIRNCKGWSSSALNSDEFKHIFKKAIGYLSTYYEIHKRMAPATSGKE